MKNTLRIYPMFVALALAIFFASVSKAETNDVPVVHQKTPDGIEYGIWGNSVPKPAPTLFMLGTTIEATLGAPYYRQCGNELAELGYLVVSIDLPCHGDQMIEGEPEGLKGWSHRAGKGEDFVTQSNVRLSKVLDHLISSGITDPAKVAAGGTSRGGFLAIHFAAHDHRVNCVTAFAPVTELAALQEFHDKPDLPFVKELSLLNQAERLSGRAVWIIIGDRDERVGTHHAVDLASRLSAIAKTKDIASNVELHVLSEPRGHTTPDGASRLAADWIHRRLTKEKPAVAESAVPASAKSANETITKHEFADPASKVVTPYLLYHPSVETPAANRSLVIFLYGAGGSLTNYNYMRTPYATLREQLAKRGYFVVVPDLGKLHFMNDAAQAALDGVVEDVSTQQQIAKDRVHVMGTSMGGGSSLAYAIRRPQLIRSVCAVMPMTDFALWVAENPEYADPVADAFGGTAQQVPEVYDKNSATKNVAAFARIPVMLIHGTSDTVVRYEHSLKLAAILQHENFQWELCTAESQKHDDEVMREFQIKVADFFDAATN